MGDKVRESETRMSVYVVMGNDFPDAVFDNEAAAEAYCEARRAQNAESGTRVYWRFYVFPLLRRGS